VVAGGIRLCKDAIRVTWCENGMIFFFGTAVLRCDFHNPEKLVIDRFARDFSTIGVGDLFYSLILPFVSINAAN
jgi:hypothetical protein